MNAKPSGRRVLSIWPTRLLAQMAALEVPRDGPKPRNVQVELGIRGTTTERPWAVTASKPGQS